MVKTVTTARCHACDWVPEGDPAAVDRAADRHTRGREAPHRDRDEASVSADLVRESQLRTALAADLAEEMRPQLADGFLSPVPSPRHPDLLVFGPQYQRSLNVGDMSVHCLPCDVRWAWAEDAVCWICGRPG